VVAADTFIAVVQQTLGVQSLLKELNGIATTTSLERHYPTSYSSIIQFIEHSEAQLEEAVAAGGTSQADTCTAEERDVVMSVEKENSDGDGDGVDAMVVDGVDGEGVPAAAAAAAALNVGVMKVAELKAELAARGLDATGKKPALATRLATAIAATATTTAGAATVSDANNVADIECSDASMEDVAETESTDQGLDLDEAAFMAAYNSVVWCAL
jgi:hypothetical protein